MGGDVISAISVMGTHGCRMLVNTSLNLNVIGTSESLQKHEYVLQSV
jgi:hypothetical protein